MKGIIALKQLTRFLVLIYTYTYAQSDTFFNLLSQIERGAKQQGIVLIIITVFISIVVVFVFKISTTNLIFSSLVYTYICVCKEAYEHTCIHTFISYSMAL